MNAHLTAKSPELFVCVLSALAFLAATESKADESGKAATPAADSMPRRSGQVRDDNELKMKLVWCPPGFVTMEQLEEAEVPVEEDNEADRDVPKNEPAFRKIENTIPVKVLLTRGYWIGKFEVTRREWKQLMRTEPWKGQRFTKDGDDDVAAAYINWDDATAFCRKLTTKERNAGRLGDDWEYTLPTEAQWERACRARTETRFSFGDDELKLGEYAWFRANAWNVFEQYAHRVGQKKANPWGLHDMHGNSWEWCRDWYEPKLPGGRDPEVTIKGSRASRVIRGGGWSMNPSECRSAHRYSNAPDDRDYYLGFRVALSSVLEVKPAAPEAK